jgi:hypothetical protein
MDDALHRELRRVKAYALFATALAGTLGLAAFQRQTHVTRFEEITVERINVVEKDGTLRLTISNRERKPDPVIGGTSYPGLRSGNRAAGLLFFNDEGNETGGLSFSGRTTANGYFASGSIAFDQFNQNEAVIVSYGDQNGTRRAGLTVLDQPEGSIQPVAESLLAISRLPDGPQKTERMARFREARRQRGEGGRTRLFAGKGADKEAVVMLTDPAGQPRLRLVVDSLGSARIEFLDATGRVTRALSDTGR